MMKNYWKPTPKKWRKFGDSLLAVATVIAMGGIWQFDNLKDLFTTTELKGMIIASIALGVVGKFLTNFFKEEEKVENPEQ
jgi:tRNA-dihydrouridine synthase